MNKFARRICRFSLGLLAVLSLTPLITTPTFATNAGASGAVSGGCSSGCCVNARANGATWVRIPYDSDRAVSLKSLLSSNLSGYMEIRNDDGTYAYSDSTVSQCRRSGGYVYVLVTPIGCYNKFAGPVAMNIANNIYDGFTGYTIPYIGGNEVLDIFNSAATDGMINGYAYNDSSSMSWFCGSGEANKTTKFQGRTTVNVASGAKTVDSGWDQFNSDTYTTTANTVRLSFTHKIRRSDNQNTKTSVKWKLATANDGFPDSVIGTNNDRTKNFTASQRNNYSKNATTKTYTVDVSSGTKTFCQGIDHELEVKVKSDGSRAASQPGIRGSAKACITIVHRNSGQQNLSSVSTNTSFIGENSTITKTGAHTITFLIDRAIGQPSNDQVRGGGTQEYGEGESSTPGADDSTQANAAICAYYNSLCHSYTEATSNKVSIDDDLNLVGAKLCAASSSRNSEYKETRTRTKYISYVNAQGETVSQPVTEYYDVYSYYWKFSDLSCSPIAAKPNFRATNGNIYTPGGISGIPASKTNGKNYNSWAEYLVVANGTLNKFGSGAAFRGGGPATPSEYSQLSVSNTNSNSLGRAGIPFTANGKDGFFSSLKDRFCPNANCSGGNGNPQVYYYSGNHTIYHDILPAQDGNTQIIYIVDGNINIDPSVTTINAWLIASGTLNTCGGKSLSDINYDTCNNDLTINGVTYASSFQLYRTKVGTGNNSDRSAETFNLTPKVYSWSAAKIELNPNSGASTPIAIEEVYTQELAPRI